VNTLLFLILFPLLPALLLAVVKHDALRALIVRLGALAIAAVAVLAAVKFLNHGPILFDLRSLPWLNRLGVDVHALDLGVFAGEAVLTLVLVAFCFMWRTRQWWIPVVVVAQFAIVAYCEFGCELPKVGHALAIDNFSLIMALIIGVIGSAICVYSLSYMKDYHHHHREMTDRRRGFFFILFLFLSGMFLIVFANNLMWMFLGWEITTLSSFLLIGYPKTEEAVRNAFHALGLNALGGLGFALALLWLVRLAPDGSRTVELDVLLKSGAAGAAMIPAVLIAFAGLTKSAQLPFSSWLLGAMVAPTPVSALLHSSTMVKAGVFVIVKFAPVFHHTLPGYLLAMVGGFTFLMTSILAMTQSNAKRVLAYSTIANLGLVVMCAGVGSETAVWAAVMLIIFHAVAKGLLFLSVGTLEHRTGSRDIEDMDGLIVARPALALAFIVGILGMFLAPFGMLISKWSCLEAITNVTVAGLGVLPPMLAVLLAFGSAPTLVFWAKWLGKIITVSPGRRGSGAVAGDETVVLGLLAVLTVAASALFPLFATYAVEPYLLGAGYAGTPTLTWNALLIMFIMLGLIVALPLLYLLAPKRQLLGQPYLAGANLADTDATGVRSFQGSLSAQNVNTANYYLADFFPEARLHHASVLVAAFVILAMFVSVVLRRENFLSADDLMSERHERAVYLVKPC
jgi:ech hydrogenase subunit A